MKIIESLKSIKEVFNKTIPSKVVLITSNKLVSKLGWAIKEIKHIAKIEVISVPDGEEAKDWNVLENILSKFIKLGLDRKALVIAMGGGTITDLAGFAASIYQRGIKTVNIPTTLLGFVDSSIGGKTAINFDGYKNQIGSFHEPEAIVIDGRFLKSLNKDQLIDGFAEIIKAGLIKDASIIKIFEEESFAGLLRPRTIQQLIRKAISVKVFYIEKDLKDNNLRQVLNFGHTIGHMVELKNKISHGKAVLYGMLEELKIGEKMGKSDKSIRSKLEKIISQFKISEKNYTIDKRALSQDKKIFGDKITIPVIKKIGEAQLITIDTEELILLCDKGD